MAEDGRERLVGVRLVGSQVEDAAVGTDEALFWGEGRDERKGSLASSLFSKGDERWWVDGDVGLD